MGLEDLTDIPPQFDGSFKKRLEESLTRRQEKRVEKLARALHDFQQWPFYIPMTYDDLSDEVQIEYKKKAEQMIEYMDGLEVRR